MASKINAKLGLRPQTRKREATHGTALVGHGQCPNCPSRHVLKTQSENGKRAGDLWCACCGAFFKVAA